jgi:IPT/TIG domain-containing protein
MSPKRCAAATVSLFGAVWGCAAKSETTATLTAISPEAAYNNAASTVLIEGGPFRPAYDFDTMRGAAKTDLDAYSVAVTAVPAPPAGGTIRLEAVSWQSPSALVATVPAGLPAGVYDVAVTDPRGGRAVLEHGFVSLGPDDQAPGVTIESPKSSSIIGAGSTVSIILAADDDQGFLTTLTATIRTQGSSSATATSRSDECLVPPGTHRTRCYLEYTAPTSLDEIGTLEITATATDTAGKTTAPIITLRLAPRPTLTSLSPSVGPATGGTPMELHGTNFVEPTDTSEGTVVLIDGKIVESAKVVSSTEITATTPLHDSGFAKLAVSTGGSETVQKYFFNFVAAPIIKLVSPTHGPMTGGTKVTIAGNHFRNPETVIYFGNVRLPALVFVGQNRLEVIAPPASAPGLVTILAYDPIGGMGMVDAYSYDPVEAGTPDAGVDPPNSDGVP